MQRVGPRYQYRHDRNDKEEFHPSLHLSVAFYEGYRYAQVQRRTERAARLHQAVEHKHQFEVVYICKRIIIKGTSQLAYAIAKNLNSSLSNALFLLLRTLHTKKIPRATSAQLKIITEKVDTIYCFPFQNSHNTVSRSMASQQYPDSARDSVVIALVTCIFESFDALKI